MLLPSSSSASKVGSLDDLLYVRGYEFIIILSTMVVEIISSSVYPTVFGVGGILTSKTRKPMPESFAPGYCGGVNTYTRDDLESAFRSPGRVRMIHKVAAALNKLQFLVQDNVNLLYVYICELGAE